MSVEVFSGFNGINFPKHSLAINAGGTLAVGGFILGVSQLGTGQLGGGAWQEITNDLTSIRRSVGRESNVDSAQVGTLDVTVDNELGDYDSSNPNGQYWGANHLDFNQYSLESGTTLGWNPGADTAITSSTTVGGFHGARSLRLNKTVSTGGAYAQTDKKRFPPGVAFRARARFQAGTTARPCWVKANFYGENDDYLGADITSASIDDAVGTWTMIEVAGVSPPETLSIVIEVLAGTNGAVIVGENHYVDTIELQPTAIEIGLPVRWLVQYDGVTYPRFYGTVTDIRMSLSVEPQVIFECSDGLETLGRAWLAQAEPTFDGNTTGTRINLLADATSWAASLRSIESGYTRLGPTVLGDFALNLMKLVEMTEYGLLFADGAGKLTFFDRHHASTATRSTTVQADLTDVELVALESLRSRDLVWNEVSITRNPNPHPPIGGGGQEEGPEDPVEQTASDAPSRDRLGVLSFPGEVGKLLKQDEDARLMAQGIVRRGRQPKSRISQVSIEAIPLDLWEVLLPLTLLDRIKIAYDYGPNTVTAEMLLQGISEEVDIEPPRWSFIFNTSNPIFNPSRFVLGSSTLGSGKLGW